MDLKLYDLGDKSFLIYYKISSLISLFSLSFFSGFLPLSHKQGAKGLNWTVLCSSLTHQEWLIVLGSHFPLSKRQRRKAEVVMLRYYFFLVLDVKKQMLEAHISWFTFCAAPMTCGTALYEQLLSP